MVEKPPKEPPSLDMLADVLGIKSPEVVDPPWILPIVSLVVPFLVNQFYG